VYRWSQRRWSVGLQCMRPSSRARRDLRSVEPGKREQSHPGLVLTKRPKHPGCPAAGSLRGGPETQAASAEAGGGLGPPDRRYTPAAATWGARALASRRGAEDHRERFAALVPNRPPALHSAELGPCCPEKQFTGLLPSTEAACHLAHRPRLERGDAPARGTRRGSSDGMAPWRHLTIGLECRSCHPGRWLAHRTRWRISTRVVTSVAGETR
jgi:hypothetical protein